MLCYVIQDRYAHLHLPEKVPDLITVLGSDSLSLFCFVADMDGTLIYIEKENTVLDNCYDLVCYDRSGS